MLAKKFTSIDEAAEALYALNADQTIRDQCLAREDYIRHENWVKNQMNELTTANETLTIENADLTTANKTLTTEKAELATANETLTAEKAELTTANEALTTENADLRAAYSEQTTLIKALQAKLAALKDS
ncbi:MAG: hypothetical protein LUC98_03670 [Lachnospiraceae bacterium]|nr:hypothetical protein [Lachnospiraceae bacterium]